MKVPPQVIHLLELFLALNAKRRRQVVVGLEKVVELPDPISSMDLGWHLRNHQQQRTPWEVETIELMDLAYREESAKLRG